VPLISPQRQVELIGAQTIVGAKTFSLTSLLLTGGDPGDVLSTTGTGGVLEWVAPGAGSAVYTFNPPLSEVGGVVDLDPATAAVIGGISCTTGTSGLLLTPAGNISLATATRVQFGGLTFATEAEVGAPAAPIDTKGISPLSLRSEMGAAASALQTTAQTVVPAINELKIAVDGLAANQHFGGGYDVAANIVIPTTGSPFPPGVLVAATAAMSGWYLICTTPATGVPGPLPPAGTYAPGDWLVVDAAPSYVHLPLGRVDFFVDGVSIINDGLTPASAFEVGLVDGGTY